MSLHTVITTLAVLAGVRASFVTEFTVNGNTTKTGDAVKSPGDAYDKKGFMRARTDTLVTNLLSDALVCGEIGEQSAEPVLGLAGQEVQMEFSAMPDGQAGPLLVYLAPCRTSCVLFFGGGGKNFIKASEILLVGDRWGSEIIGDKAYSWTIPKDLEPGEYLLRTEMINVKIEPYGSYICCYQLRIAGSGTSTIAESDKVGFPGAYLIAGLEVLSGKTSDVPSPGPPVWTQCGNVGSSNITNDASSTSASASSSSTSTSSSTSPSSSAMKSSDAPAVGGGVISRKDDEPPWVLMGGIGGGTAAIALLLLCCCCYRRRRTRQAERQRTHKLMALIAIRNGRPRSSSHGSKKAHSTVKSARAVSVPAAPAPPCSSSLAAMAQPTLVITAPGSAYAGSAAVGMPPAYASPPRRATSRYADSPAEGHLFGADVSNPAIRRPTSICASSEAGGRFVVPAPSSYAPSERSERSRGGRSGRSRSRREEVNETLAVPASTFANSHATHSVSY